MHHEPRRVRRDSSMITSSGTLMVKRCGLPFLAHPVPHRNGGANVVVPHDHHGLIRCDGVASSAESLQRYGDFLDFRVCDGHLRSCTHRRLAFAAAPAHSCGVAVIRSSKFGICI
jgi:hypothetical protein